jgi:hypothetical protein
MEASPKGNKSIHSHPGTCCHCDGAKEKVFHIVTGRRGNRRKTAGKPQENRRRKCNRRVQILHNPQENRRAAWPTKRRKTAGYTPFTIRRDEGPVAGETLASFLQNQKPRRAKRTTLSRIALTVTMEARPWVRTGGVSAKNLSFHQSTGPGGEKNKSFSI